MAKISVCLAWVLLAISFEVQAAWSDAQLAVWANEAIVGTYSYNYKNFMQQQKDIAKYFTAEGWTSYSNALLASKIPDVVKTNSYFVSAVATSPPTVKALAANHWQAEMPLLVVYKNSQYQQKQTLEVTIDFIQAPTGQGIRGLAIRSLDAKVVKPACRCDLGEENKGNTTTGTGNAAKPSQDAK